MTTFEGECWHALAALFAPVTAAAIYPLVNGTIMVFDNLLSSPLSYCFPVDSPDPLGHALDSGQESSLVPLTTCTILPLYVAKIAEVVFAWTS